jgi:GNAT superfamily N-acetyltransferase
MCRKSVLAITKRQPEKLLAHWADMLSPERLGKVISSHTTFVAVEKSKIHGFASLEGTDVLGMLYVHPDKQRKGIATSLLLEVAKEAQSKETTFIDVDASLNCLEAYYHWGFAEDDVVEKTDAQGVTYRVHRMHASVAKLLE